MAVEKNIEAFLALTLPGTKVVIGDGPQRAALQARYPDAHFLGAKFGTDLARHVAAADVFVFPSLTDTFGLVMLEALACGLPVAAFPVAGPKDVVREGEVGALDWDLAKAVERALTLSTRRLPPLRPGLLLGNRHPAVPVQPRSRDLHPCADRLFPALRRCGRFGRKSTRGKIRRWKKPRPDTSCSASIRCGSPRRC